MAVSGLVFEIWDRQTTDTRRQKNDSIA